MTWFAASLTVIGVLFADQATKALVMSRPAWRPPAMNRSFLSVRPTMNRRRVAVSVLGRAPLAAMWLALATIGALALHAGMLGDGALGAVGVSAVVGGAAGNLVDQLRRGAIVDFIAIGPWPVFNIADAAIVVGVGLVLLTIR